MLKAYKYRIYPNKKQERHLLKSFGCCRYIYNKALNYKIEVYSKEKKSVSCFDLIGGILKEEKQKHDWLIEPYSQCLQMSIKNLDNAFTKFFKEKKGFPKFKKKSNKQSISYPQGVKVDFKTNKIILPKIKKVKCVFDREFIGKIKTCTVSKTQTNKYYISILVDDGKELPLKVEIEENTTIGLDLGLKSFIVTSDGLKVNNPKHFSNLEKRLKVLQKRASRKKKGSKNKKKANLKVAKIHERIKNQRNDFLHKLSTKLIRENQSICLEDLNISGMLKNHKLAKSISSVSWSEFTRQLNYKSNWYGKNIITIGRFEPSSKTCNCCGNIYKELKLNEREWVCKNCGIKHDRDLNASKNIKSFGLLRCERYKEESRLGKPLGLSEMSGN